MHWSLACVKRLFWNLTTERLQAPGASASQQSAQPALVDTTESVNGASPFAQDGDGWEQQANWDFQDVPLDSPRATTGKAATAAQHAIALPTDFPSDTVATQSSTSDQDIAALQTVKVKLLQQLKRSEQVRCCSQASFHFQSGTFAALLLDTQQFHFVHATAVMFYSTALCLMKPLYWQSDSRILTAQQLNQSQTVSQPVAVMPVLLLI